MGKIFYVMGKSSSGKDTIFKNLIADEKLNLQTIVMYTTRPIRVGEKDGREYFFSDEESYQQMKRRNLVIESRTYHTIHGDWRYFTVHDRQVKLEENNYAMIGTLESYHAIRAYYGKEVLVPIYIEVENGERLQRALDRERQQDQPNYQEVCRRFLADEEDFSEENIEKEEIGKRFQNRELKSCLEEIKAYLMEYL